MDLINGFINLFTNLEALGFVILASFVGIVAGALPGLTASAAIAMLLPLSFHFDALSALAFLYVIGKSGRYGGPSQLFSLTLRVPPPPPQPCRTDTR